MTVFQLMVYSCVSLVAPISGDLMQKTCTWAAQGALYAKQEACEANAPKIGSPVFSDVMDGRTVEKTHYAPQTVQQ